MARIFRFGRAGAAHRRAAALVSAAEAALTGHLPRPRPATEDAELYTLAERLSAAAGDLAPGWLGAPLAGDLPPAPLAEQAVPGYVRVGTARLPGGADFPAVVPWRHLAIDSEPDDPRTLAALRALLLRLLAATPAGALAVRLVDPAGSVAGPFGELHRAGLLPAPVTDLTGLSAVLDEAARWDAGPARHLVVLIAGWPDGTAPAVATRLADLAGHSRDLHLIVGGWPPPAAGEVLLPETVVVTRCGAHARVGHPPGGSFAAGRPPGTVPSAGLNATVELDTAPPGWIEQVCAQLARAARERTRAGLGDVLPGGPFWTEDATGGLMWTMGRPAGPPTVLRFGNPTWHWLVGGRSGSGKTTLLRTILYGLASRYPPDQLAVYLLDPTANEAFTELAAALPHARTPGVGSVNRVRAGLHEVAAQVAGRHGPVRTVCVLDNLHQLRDSQARELLHTLASADPQRGVHLLLAGEGRPAEPLAGRCRARIALPGAEVLDPANQAAAGIALGTGVVNTAGGLGGPPGATRAHEQLVQFTDPQADPDTLTLLRQWFPREPA